MMQKVHFRLTSLDHERFFLSDVRQLEVDFLNSLAVILNKFLGKSSL